MVVGAGKASAAMARAFEAAWSGPLEGLVITRYGHAVPCGRIEVVEAGHPVPDEAGEHARPVISSPWRAIWDRRISSCSSHPVVDRRCSPFPPPDSRWRTSKR